MNSAFNVHISTAQWRFTLGQQTSLRFDVFRTMEVYFSVACWNQPLKNKFPAVTNHSLKKTGKKKRWGKKGKGKKMAEKWRIKLYI